MKRAILIALLSLVGYLCSAQVPPEFDEIALTGHIRAVMSGHSVDIDQVSWQFRIYESSKGLPVLTQGLETIVDIAWHDNESRSSEKKFKAGDPRQTLGHGLGYYILTQTNQSYILYGHLNPEAPSTASWRQTLEDAKSRGKDGVTVSKRTQIGEIGDTGYSPYPNLLYAQIQKPVEN